MTSQALETRFPRCPECGGAVQLKARAGRTREYLKGVHLPIPADFGIPTCTKCGEESMSLDLSEELDAQLGAVLTQQLHGYVATIRRKYSVTQAEIEDALRVTRSYLSHVLSGRKPPSGTLVEMLSLFADVPGALEHALRRPVATTVSNVPAVLLLRDVVTWNCYSMKRGFSKDDELPAATSGSSTFDCRAFTYQSEFHSRTLSSRPPRIGQG